MGWRNYQSHSLDLTIQDTGLHIPRDRRLHSCIHSKFALVPGLAGVVLSSTEDLPPMRLGISFCKASVHLHDGSSSPIGPITLSPGATIHPGTGLANRRFT